MALFKLAFLYQDLICAGHISLRFVQVSAPAGDCLHASVSHRWFFLYIVWQGLEEALWLTHLT